MLTGILVTLFFIALPVGIFYSYRRLTMDTSLTEESDRAAAEKAFDEADALMVSEAFDSYSTTALGPPNKPAFYHVQKERQFYEWMIIGSTGVALVTGLAAGALSAGRREPV